MKKMDLKLILPFILISLPVFAVESIRDLKEDQIVSVRGVKSRIVSFADDTHVNIIYLDGGELQNGVNIIDVDLIDECPICMEEFRDADPSQIKANKCNHRFHRICAKAWIRANQNCPLCNEELRVDDIECRENVADSPLFQAINAVDVRTVEALLRAGSDPNEIGATGRSALWTTIEQAPSLPSIRLNEYGTREWTQITNAKIASLLISAGANIHEIELSTGKTLLMLAASHNNIPIGTHLVNAGIDADLVNNDGETAIDIARQRNFMFADSIDKIIQKNNVDPMPALAKIGITNEACAICLVNFKTGDILQDPAGRGCQHSSGFHINCIVKNDKYSHKCPLCKEPMPPESLHSYFYLE